VVADAHLIGKIESACTGAAPGLSGWTAEMVSVLAKDNECLTGIARIMQDISNGALPPQIKPFLLSSMLVGIDKDSGQGIRPIAIGEIFYRLAAYSLLHDVMDDIRRVLLPIQLGVSVSGGCETIITNLNHILEQGATSIQSGSSLPMAALAIDFANAFNTISRAFVLDTLYSHPSLNRLWDIVDFAYSEPSDLYIHDEDGILAPRIVSSEGVRQGDPLSSALFSLAIHPIYKQTLCNHPLVCGAAILDDFTMVGQSDHLIAAYRTLQQQAARINLRIKPEKSQLIYCHHEVHPLPTSVMDFIRDEGVQLSNGAAIVLGAPVGSYEERAMLTRDMIDREMKNLGSLLHEELPAQEAILLLRSSYTHKLDFLLRCVPPSIMVSEANRFDQAVITTFAQKTDIAIQLGNPSIDRNMVVEQIRLPVSDGGFGIPHTGSLSHRAYISSVASTVQSSVSLALFSLNHHRRPHSLSVSSSSSIFTEVSDSLTQVQQQISSHDFDLLLPPTASSFFPSFAPPAPQQHNRTRYRSFGLQSELSEAANKRRKVDYENRIKGTDNDEDRARELARLHGVSAPQSSTWINTVADTPLTTLPNDYYRTAVRLRLGLPPVDVSSHDCHSCRRSSRSAPSSEGSRGIMERDPWHHLNCMEGHGGDEISIRHHLIVNAIARYSRLAGAVAIVEPQHLFNNSRRRPDLRVILNYITYLIDVTVTNPMAPSHMHHVKQPLSQAKRAEKDKERSYRDALESLGPDLGSQRAVRFVPFVLEAFGGMGTQAETFLSHLSAFTRDHLSAWSHQDIVGGLKRAIATAVQQGNGMIILAGYNNSTRESNTR
jgi:hypothetical protein